MNQNETIKTSKNSFSFISLTLSVAAILMGGVIFGFLSQRQYFPTKVAEKDSDVSAKGMQAFFFNARKNAATNSMDYHSMLAADMADRAMSNMRKTPHGLTATTPGLNFTWNSMGPTNIGGRTRAILIDQNDPTHQTVFAGGVSGGIWKSTNGGSTWDNAGAALVNSIDDTLSNINICSIAQDANGAIYIGTGEGFSLYDEGEGFSTAILGGGMFKSTNDGATWRLLSSTKPTTANSGSVAWAYINRIAIRPDSFQVIYAATNTGLMVSHDSGATWNTAVNATSHVKLSYNSLDVKISGDGSIVVACINGSGYYCYPQTGNDNDFTEITHTGVGKLPAGAARIEFAISPTDPNRIYASDIANVATDDQFQSSSASGVFMTTTAKTNGGHWFDIGPGGSIGFDPYAEPGGGDDQATYDNTVGVPPANEAQVLCGGTTLWEWSGSSLTDTVGSWQKISHYSAYYPGDPLWIHADEHAIVFDQTNTSVVYFGCDGGLFKCSNMSISPSDPETSIANLDIQPINRNYNVTQYYSICYSPVVDSLTGLGLGGGTQDNGSPYINGLAVNYPYDGTDMSGGDGAGSVVSALNPNIAYFCSDNGYLERTGDLGNLSFPTIAYNQTSGYDIGGDIDSVWELGGACFVFPVALYENAYDTLNLDSLQFIATTTYSTGQIIWPTSQNGPTTYPYVLPHALAAGDTLTVPDRVVSRLAIGFTPAAGGIWINGQGANSTGTVVWMPIAGPLSKPTAYADGGGAPDVHCITWAPDGNTLYAGTEDGVLFRFTNINSIIANTYKSGALWSKRPGIGIKDTSNQVLSKDLTFAAIAGRDILSVAVDPNNINNMMVTLGGYGYTDNVYYTDSALGLNPAFYPVQGSGTSALPAMPVYSSILDVFDSVGHWVTNSAIVATEHGVYTTSNINAGGTTGNAVKWTKTNSSGMPNVMTLAIKQQTAPSWLCNNSGVIYAGTHGRGVWAANNNYNITTSVPKITGTASPLNSLLVYPNPMTNEGNIEFNLASADNVLITVYDMQGREMKTINMGTQSPGNHLVTFESSGFSAGTYFASLTGSNFKKVSKFIVVK